MLCTMLFALSVKRGAWLGLRDGVVDGGELWGMWVGGVHCQWGITPREIQTFIGYFGNVLSLGGIGV